MNLRTFLVYTASKEINSLYDSRIKYTIMTRCYLIVKKDFFKSLINRIFKTSLEDISIDIKIEQNKVIPELYNYDRDYILRELENERFKCDNWIMCLSTNDPVMTAKINHFIKEVKDGKR